MARNTENGNTANVDKWEKAVHSAEHLSPTQRSPMAHFQYTLLKTLDTGQSSQVSQEANDTAIEHSKLMLR